MRLYEINELVENSFIFDEETGDMINPETGELLSIEEFETLKLERNERIDNLLCLIRNMEASVEAYKNEAERFQQKKKQADLRVNNLKKFVKALLNGSKFRSRHFNVSYRKSEQVIVTDINQIPKEYLRIKPAEPDKSAIKKAIKEGTEIKGAGIVENLNMIIK